MIYDQYGRPVSPAIKRPKTREISVASIRDRWSGYPSAGLTPGRLASIFMEADNGDMYRQAELFEEMEEKDGHLFAQFQTRKLAVQGLPWEITPASETGRDVEVADFCRDQISGLNYDEILLDMLDALPKGYSMMEIMWDVSSGQAKITGIKWIHPKKVTFRETMNPRILTESERVNGIAPPPFKTCFHRYKARSGYDTRAGILRVCAWMYLFKNYSIKDWIAFSEVYGQPVRLGKFDPGSSQTDKDALINAVRGIGTDAAGIISKNTEIEFVEANKYSSVDVYEKLIGFCDSQMSKAIVGQVLTSDSGSGSGSYALGRVHGDVRYDLLEADSAALSRTIQNQVLRPVVGFNFGWETPVPKFKILCEPAQDLKRHAEIYKVLYEMGFPFSAEHISERFRIPMLRPGETPLSSRETAKGKNVPVRAKDNQAGYPDYEDLETRAAEASQGTFNKMVEPVLKMISRADSMEEIGEKLFSMFPEMDPERFQEHLARSMSASALTGYGEAADEESQ